ncbi:putative leucine-rich repeat-containing protein DDB_G0290503 isoform X2 [Halyomorpha halys]|uniref:putative leucine-rich repeat-containing protein DDB_G0290503 isoform X2 n=1 Tax=Halyomorpha halys TaxID=286706 RepID=UPI0006D4F061|nr:uncharacterized protein PF11_0213-like [Halyomorpha halys]
MILYRIFYNKYEVNDFMKFLIFLSMIITSSQAARVHSSQKSPLQNNLNETLSDQDFEDSLNPNVLSEQNYSLPDLLEKDQLIENEINFLSSTLHNINSLKKKKSLQSKKHRNIIKMVCDSDNLISQMTLHMNFLDNSKDEKHHDFTFKKIFNADDPKNEVLFSYPEVTETLSEKKSDENGENPVKEMEFSVSKPYNENESFKKDNINYLLLNEEYDTYPVSKKKKSKTQAYTKDDYKSEIKKFNSGFRVESSKLNRENYSNIHVKEKKKNNKVKFWVTAMAFTDTLQNSEDFEKNNLLHKLHISQSSEALDPLPLNSYTTEAEDFNSVLDNNDSIIPEVIDNIEQAQNNTQNDQYNSFSDKEFDGENKNNEEVLNYSKKFKKYKLENSKHTIDENESINQLDNSFLYDYPVSYKKQYHFKTLNKDNDQINKAKVKKKYKLWKNNLVAQPKMKSIISSNRAQFFGETDSAAISGKKKKTLERQKVIENLKFILGKQNSEHPRTDRNLLQSKYFPKEKIKVLPKMFNFSKTFRKKNSTKVFNILDNGNNYEPCNQIDDREIDSSSTMEEILLAYQNQNIPFHIYDVDMNDNDVKTKLRNEELFHLTNSGKNKKSVKRRDLNSKLDIYHKKENKLTNTKGNDKQYEPNQHEKYFVKRQADDKGEEIRKGVFLKKGIPLQFNPYQGVNELDNKQLLGLRTMSPVGRSQMKLRNENEKPNSQAENSFKSKEQKNSQSNYENLKIDVKRDAMSGSTYQKAYRRFLRDIALIKFLDDKCNGESIFFSN